MLDQRSGATHEWVSLFLQVSTKDEEKQFLEKFKLVAHEPMVFGLLKELLAETLKAESRDPEKRIIKLFNLVEPNTVERAVIVTANNIAMSNNIEIMSKLLAFPKLFSPSLINDLRENMVYYPSEIQELIQHVGPLKKKTLSDHYTSPIDDFINEHFMLTQGLGELSSFLDPIQRDEIKEKFHQDDSVVKIKKTVSVPYTVIKAANNELFAIYNGTFAKGGFSNEMGKGLSLIRLAQNINTGKFCLVKIAKGEKINKKETQFLEQTGGFLGELSRKNKENIDKYYIFMEIVPGLTLKNMAKYYVLDKVEESTILLNVFLKMKELQENHIIHRDLNDGNVLIHPETKEVNFIDYGQSLHADEHGYCVLERSDGRQFRFANGIDVIGIVSTLNELIRDENLRSIYNALINKVGKTGEFNNVDFYPVIDKIREYQFVLHQSESERALPMSSSSSPVNQTERGIGPLFSQSERGNSSTISDDFEQSTKPVRPKK